MPGWLSDEELEAKLAGVLKQQDAGGDADPDALPAWWRQHVADANADAYGSILSVLGSRGFTAAALRAWPLGRAYQTDLALYRVLIKGVVTEPYDTKDLDRLNRLAELETLILTDAAGNVLEPPDTAAAGAVGFGSMLRDDERMRNPDGTWRAW